MLNGGMELHSLQWRTSCTKCPAAGHLALELLMADKSKP